MTTTILDFHTGDDCTIFWWVRDNDPNRVYFRFADYPSKRSSFVTMHINGKRETTSRCSLDDRLTDAVNAFLFSFGAVDASRAATSRYNAVHAELFSASVRHEEQLAAAVANGKTRSEYLREQVLTHESRGLYIITDRVACTSVTSHRATANCLRVLLHDAGVRTERDQYGLISLFDWTHKVKVPDERTVTPATADDVRGLPDPTPTSITSKETPTMPETDTDTNTASTSAEYAQLAQLANAVGIQLDAFIASHAPAPQVVTVDPNALPADASMVPASDPNFNWKGSGWQAATTAMDAASNVGARSVVLVTGPTGCGKTMGALQYAAERKRAAYVLDCSTLQEPTDAFGALVADEGSTKFVPSRLVDMLATDGAVVILDEVNRATATVRNAFFALLDSRGQTTIESVLDENGDPITVRVAGNATIVMTANVGAAYRGTDRIDAAFRNRADIEVKVDYLKLASERALLRKVTNCSKVDANVIATFAAWTRDESRKLAGGAVSQAVSTRRSLASATHASRGIDLLDSMTIGMINSIDDDIEHAAAIAYASALISTGNAPEAASA